MAALTLRSLTEDKLREYFARKARQRELEREARALEVANKKVESDLEGVLRAEGRTRARKGVFEFGFTDGHPSVRWKEEFIRVAGAEEAARLVAEAPVPQRLTVTQLGPA